MREESVTEARLLLDQIQYYRARAAEYDQWFERQGRYDRGAAHRAAWLSEAALVERAVIDTVVDADVLELACGTGLWTRHLVAGNRRVTALDASPEAIALNRARIASPDVRYIVGDVFAPPTASTFDAVFFSFWLSHVPPRRFDAFWSTVRGALKPGGRAFFIDSLPEPTSTAVDHERPDDSGVVRRTTNDGRRFEIVKVFYDPPALERRLQHMGWQGPVRTSGRFFLYGSLVRPE